MPNATSKQCKLLAALFGKKRIEGRHLTTVESAHRAINLYARTDILKAKAKLLKH